MKVFKFGGASVRDAEAVKYIPDILSHYSQQKLVIILSAMGKTTNALESLTDAFFHNEPKAKFLLGEIADYHREIINNLFPDQNHPVYTEFNLLVKELKEIIFSSREQVFGQEALYDLVYDQIVCFGELFSTKIVSYYLDDSGIKNSWYDVRQLIKTDETYREGRVDWEWTSHLINDNVGLILEKKNIMITQGFIASNSEGKTITLGREGSDYTAAIFANVLDAEEMIVWKDVPGLMNADPKCFDPTEMLEQISYSEAIELTYYGAKVIHPKTLKPLQNKSIPLSVKCFLKPGDSGSLIHNATIKDTNIPSFIFKYQQVLLSISSKDHSFIAEETLHYIFGLFANYKLKINVMQTSAISFSVCVDKVASLKDLISDLQVKFIVRFNEDLELITIRHYDKPAIDKVLADKEILLEQRSRSTIQMVVR